MKTITLYFAQERLTETHFPVIADDGTTVFIRATASNEDDQEALDSAKPIQGETVLNTKTISY